MDEINQTNSRRIIGGGLVVVGILVAIAQMAGLNLGQTLWPLYIIAPGVVLFALGARSGDIGKGLTIAGATVTTTGLILAYQNTFNHFESWAYAWALIAPGAAGFGLWLHGRREGDAGVALQGRTLINIGAALFLFGAIFFELIINISGRGMPEIFSGSLVLPGILVIAGLAVVFWPRRPGGEAD